MKRRWFAVMGFAFVLAGVASVAVVKTELTANPLFALAVLAWILAGVLDVLGGLGVSAGGVEWYQFVGGGNVVLGLLLAAQLPLSLLHGSPETELLLSQGAGAIGGLALAWIGFDWIRGGRHFDLSEYDDGSILGS